MWQRGRFLRLCLCCACRSPITIQLATIVGRLAGPFRTQRFASKAVVHRDIKPENVLLYQGRWCLADFGIARYAAATTAPDTHKFSMTPAYAAPEQWREERATAATDVYAFGVMAFEMLEGHRPFPGPTAPDFRAQHLSQPPPTLAGCPPSLASLVTECMYKQPQARPSATNILARLRASQQAPSPAAARLQAINQRFVAKQAEEEAKASEQQSAEQVRVSLLTVSEQSLRQIQDTLIERILDAVPTANVTRGPRPSVRFGNAVLAFQDIRPAPPNVLASHQTARFDVIAHTTISVRKPQDRFEYEGRSHSLWYCDAQEKGVYRWYEMAFMQAWGGGIFNVAPFDLAPEEAGIVFSNVVGTRQLARRPRPFDQGEEEQFIERWIDWFASAADGTLQYPSRLPED